MKYLLCFFFTSLAMISCGTFNEKRLPYLQISSTAATNYLNKTFNNMTSQKIAQGYAEGYIHGCGTGYRTVGFKNFPAKKEKQKYSRNSYYKNGWQDGYKNCQQEAYKVRDNKRAAYLNEMTKKHNQKIIIWEDLKK